MPSVYFILGIISFKEVDYSVLAQEIILFLSCCGNQKTYQIRDISFNLAGIFHHHSSTRIMHILDSESCFKMLSGI